jgi:uncharacterized low-complexity protein
MSEKKVVKPVALAVGAALVGSFAIGGAVNADTVESPFSMSTLSAGYMLGTGEGSCGEGSCGEKEGEKKGEGSCGEGSCGEKEGEGACGEKEGEGSCGEGSCGADSGEKEGEGSCGGAS